MKILCLVPSLPEDLNSECANAILYQTVPVTDTFLLLKRLRGGTLSSRVSYVLNKALQTVNLQDYDYLLRVDGDTVLKPNWLKTALESNMDLYGGWGFAMLIRVKPFLELMNGRFNNESDDSYIIHRFCREGLKVYATHKAALLTTRKHKHNKSDQMFCGTIYYKMGYEPLHALAFLVTNRGFKDMWLLWTGYLISWLRHERKFDFASRTWNYQVRRLIRI
jgi:hypothetical protein